MSEVSREEEAEDQDINSVLQRMVRMEAEIKKTPFPIKKHKPKVTRMQSPRMREVLRGTRNPVRAIYQAPDVAKAHTVTDEPVNPTREVGPGDVHNKTNDYSAGKETQTRLPSPKEH